MKNIFTFLSLALLPALAFAQPANDECGASVPVLAQSTADAPTYTAISTTGATQSAPNPSCTGVSNNDDVYFRFVPTAAEVTLRYRNFAATGGTSSGLGYTVYTACPGDANAVEVECDFSFGTPPAGEQRLGLLEPGQTYFLRLFAQGGSSFADFELALTSPSGNDACSASAPVLPVAAVGGTIATTSVSTVGATQGPRTNCSVTWLNDDVYYQFVANATGVSIEYSNLVTASGTAATGARTSAATRRPYGQSTSSPASRNAPTVDPARSSVRRYSRSCRASSPAACRTRQRRSTT